MINNRYFPSFYCYTNRQFETFETFLENVRQDFEDLDYPTLDECITYINSLTTIRHISTTNISDILANDHVKELWQLIANIYIKHEIFVYGNDEEREVIDEKEKDFLLRVISLIRKTYQRYTKLLDTYQEKIDTLMSQVSSTTSAISKYNDTPQTADDGSLANDPYVSNISKTEAQSGSDYDTPMARINEIQKYLRNIMDDWTKEFSGLFIEERIYL